MCFTRTFGQDTSACVIHQCDNNSSAPRSFETARSSFFILNFLRLLPYHTCEVHLQGGRLIDFLEFTVKKVEK